MNPEPSVTVEVSAWRAILRLWLLTIAVHATWPLPARARCRAALWLQAVGVPWAERGLRARVVRS